MPINHNFWRERKAEARNQTNVTSLPAKQMTVRPNRLKHESRCAWSILIFMQCETGHLHNIYIICNVKHRMCECVCVCVCDTSMSTHTHTHMHACMHTCARTHTHPHLAHVPVGCVELSLAWCEFILFMELMNSYVYLKCYGKYYSCTALVSHFI